MSKFSGKRLSHFPSAGWLSNLRSEMSFLAKNQIANEMLNTDFGNEGITLHSDGTSKFQRHFRIFKSQLQKEKHLVQVSLK
jgi:hypothetical protein